MNLEASIFMQLFIGGAIFGVIASCLVFSIWRLWDVMRVNGVERAATRIEFVLQTVSDRPDTSTALLNLLFEAQADLRRYAKRFPSHLCNIIGAYEQSTLPVIAHLQPEGPTNNVTDLVATAQNAKQRIVSLRIAAGGLRALDKP